MSVSHPSSITFRIADGPTLENDYDEQADILDLWIGNVARAAISVTRKEGHLVRLDPDTHELVGFTLFDFCRRWQPDDPGGEIDITITTPSLGRGAGNVTEASERHLVPA